MANPSKAKGTRWESAVVNYLHEFHRLGHARRKVQTGRLDEGDIALEPFTIQAKAAKAFDLAGWVRDAEEQNARAGMDYGLVAAKAPGKPTAEGYAILRLQTFARLAAEVVALRAEVERLRLGSGEGWGWG